MKLMARKLIFISIALAFVIHAGESSELIAPTDEQAKRLASIDSTIICLQSQECITQSIAALVQQQEVIRITVCADHGKTSAECGRWDKGKVQILPKEEKPNPPK